MHAPRRILTSVALIGALSISAIGCSSSSSKGGTNGDFCTKLRKYQADKSLNSQTSSGDYTKASAAFDDLAASAPSEIKAEVTLFQTYLHNVVAAGTDSAKLAKLQTPAESAKLTAASTKLTDYSKNTCKIKAST